MDPILQESRDKIRVLLSNPQVINKIIADMNAQNLPLNTPCLKLEVIGNEEAYELEVQDVKDVFSVFGEVQQVSVIPYGMALIMYKEIVPAYFAQKSLDGKNLQPMGAFIKVSWYYNQDNVLINQKQSSSNQQSNNQEQREEESSQLSQTKEEEESKLALQSQEPKALNGGNTKDLQSQYPIKKQNQTSNQSMQSQSSGYQTKAYKNNQSYQNNISNQSEDLGANSRLSAKFTCRYEIQIQNEKDFQVARRIIGPRGSNMKKVVDLCVRDMPMHYQAQDVIKLRLRGIGSGFKEGPNQQDEPLHLCVSSKYQDKFLLACEQCEVLLKQIYDDYRSYCKQRGIEIKNLQLKKQQSPNQLPQQQNVYLRNYEIGSNPSELEIQA